MKQKTKPEKTQPFITLSGRSATGWGCFIICSFVLFFFIGTLVGRGSIKVDLGQQALSDEINNYAKSINDASGEDVEIIDDTPDLLFYDNLEKNENARLEPKRSATQKTVKKVKKVIKKKTSIIKPKLASAVKKEPKKTPAKKEIQKKKTVPADKKDIRIFKYAIQVASFKGLNDAKKTVSEFKQKGYSAYYVKAVVRNHEVWYRVRIGAFKDRIDAGKTLARLEKNNIDGFLVTR